jgi:SAM-dependent methyltransferase
MSDWRDDLREGYDRVAADYAARLAGELDHKPFDRALLDRFAALVRPLGPAADLGCGPGQVARALHERGLTTIGIDLAPGMIAEARRLHPGLDFRVGDLLALDLPDESLGGIAAFYALIHVPRDRLPRALAECRRVLRPGGALLVAVHLGDSDVHLREFFGRPVALDFFFFDRAEIERHLTTAGFALWESHEREPYPGVEHPSRRAYLVARRP